jgi:hypothetical protein
VIGVVCPECRKMVMLGAAGSGLSVVVVGCVVMKSVGATAGAASTVLLTVWEATLAAAGVSWVENACASNKAKLCAPMMVANVLPVTSDMRTAKRFVALSFPADILLSPLLDVLKHRAKSRREF